MKPWKTTPETCATCAIRQPQTSVCQLTGLQVSNDDFCSKHVDHLDTCELCHRPITQPLVFITPEGKEKVKFICPECFRSFDSCRMCASGRSCAFDEDRTMPKMVMKTIRQGGMVAQTQVRNPDLVDKTCKAGCKCWNDIEQYCSRQDNYCIEHTYQSPF